MVQPTHTPRDELRSRAQQLMPVEQGTLEPTHRVGLHGPQAGATGDAEHGERWASACRGDGASRLHELGQRPEDVPRTPAAHPSVVRFATAQQEDRSSSTGRTTFRASEYVREVPSGGLSLWVEEGEKVAELGRSHTRAELWYAFRPWAARALLRRTLLLANPMIRRTMLARWRLAAARGRAGAEAQRLAEAHWALRGQRRRLRAALRQWLWVASAAACAGRARAHALSDALGAWHASAGRQCALRVADRLFTLTRQRRCFTRWVWARLWRQLGTFRVSRRAMVLGARSADGVARILQASPRLAGGWRTWLASVRQGAQMLEQAAAYAARQRLPNALRRWRLQLARRERARCLAHAAVGRARHAARYVALVQWRAECARARARVLLVVGRARQAALKRGMGAWRESYAREARALSQLCRGCGHAARCGEARAWHSLLAAREARWRLERAVVFFMTAGRRDGMHRWASGADARADALERAERALGHWAHRDTGRAWRAWSETRMRRAHAMLMAVRAVAAARIGSLERALRMWAGTPLPRRLHQGQVELSGAALARFRALARGIRRWRTHGHSRRRSPLAEPLFHPCSFLWHAQPLSAPLFSALRTAAVRWSEHCAWRGRCARAVKALRHRHERRALNAARSAAVEAAAHRCHLGRAAACVRHQSESRGWRCWAGHAIAVRWRRQHIAHSLARLHGRAVGRAYRCWVDEAMVCSVNKRRIRFGGSQFVRRELARAWRAWRDAATDRRRDAQALRRALLASSATALDAWREVAQREGLRRRLLALAIGRFRHTASARILTSWRGHAECARCVEQSCRRALGRALLAALAWWREASRSAGAIAALMHARIATWGLTRPLPMGFGAWVEFWRKSCGVARARRHHRRSALSLIHI